MSEADPNGATPATEPGTADPTPSIEPPADDKHAAGLRRELVRHRDEAKTLREQLATLQAAETERQRKAAEEKGEYKRLYEESAAKVEALTGQVTELTSFREQVEQAAEARRIERLEALGDEWRADIPDDATGAELDRLLAITEKAKARVTAAATTAPADPPKAKVPAGTGNADGSQPADVITAEEKAWLDKRHPHLRGASTAVQRKMLDKFGPNRGAN